MGGQERGDAEGGHGETDNLGRLPRGRIAGNMPTKNNGYWQGKKMKKKVSSRWRGGRTRGGGETAVRRKRGEEERD